MLTRGYLTWAFWLGAWGSRLEDSLLTCGSAWRRRSVPFSCLANLDVPGRSMFRVYIHAAPCMGLFNDRIPLSAGLAPSHLAPARLKARGPVAMVL